MNSKINGSTGEVAVNVGAKLDREGIQTFNLTVLATDKGYPVNTGTASITITVNDVNDVKPVFSQSVWETTVQENAAKYQKVF